MTAIENIWHSVTAWFLGVLSASELVNGLIVTLLVLAVTAILRFRGQSIIESPSQIRRAIIADTLLVEINIKSCTGDIAEYKKEAHYKVAKGSVNTFMEKLYCDGIVEDISFNSGNSFSSSTIAGQCIYHVNLDRSYRRGEKFHTKLSAILKNSFPGNKESWTLEIGYRTKSVLFRVKYPKDIKILNFYAYRKRDLDLILQDNPPKMIDGDEFNGVEWQINKAKIGEEFTFQWEININDVRQIEHMKEISNA